MKAHNQIGYSRAETGHAERRSFRQSPNNNNRVLVRFAQERHLAAVGALLHRKYVNEEIIQPRPSRMYYGKLFDQDGEILIAETPNGETAATLGMIEGEQPGDASDLPLASNEQFASIMNLDLEMQPCDTKAFELTAFAARERTQSGEKAREFHAPLLGDVALRTICSESRSAYVGIVTHPRYIDFYTNRFGFNLRAIAPDYSVQDKSLVPGALLTKRIGQAVSMDPAWPHLMKMHDRRMWIDPSMLRVDYIQPPQGIKDALKTLANAETPDDVWNAYIAYKDICAAVYDVAGVGSDSYGGMGHMPAEGILV